MELIMYFVKKTEHKHVYGGCFKKKKTGNKFFFQTKPKLAQLLTNLESLVMEGQWAINVWKTLS